MSSRSAMPLLLPLTLAAAACDRQAPAPSQANAVASADEVPAANSAAPSKIGEPDRAQAGAAAPTATFQDPAGKTITLAAFRGRPVLVNLWATCVKELPTLDALAAGDVRVVAISQDMDASKPAPFLAQKGLTRLAAYRDPKMALATALGANLPTTILYDAAGKEVWRVTGERDWSSGESKALVRGG
jgi:thiol-disulfide isomerase/thioredoxin